MKKSRDWIATVCLILVIFAFGCMVFFYYDQYYGGGLVEKIINKYSTEEEQEELPQPERLTVNPEYDGTNSEYHYVEGDDGYDVVSTIEQTTVFRYYSNSGDAIAEIDTISYDRGRKIKMLSSNHRRDQVRRPDTSVAKMVEVRSYDYSGSAITCSVTTTSYAADGSEITSTTTESSRPR